MEDATLQVAIERAREAYRASAAPHTLTAFDLAYEATETVARLSAAERSEGGRGRQAVEALESEPVAFEASEAWLRAAESLLDAAEAAKDAESASDDAAAAVEVSRAAEAEAEAAAWAIYRAAQGDGGWEALITDSSAHLAAAMSATDAVEEDAVKAVEAQIVAEAAAEEASKAAWALAEQSGATNGVDAYRAARYPGLWPASFDADLAASAAAGAAKRASENISDTAQAVEDAAWYVARVSADGLIDRCARTRVELLDA